MFSSFIRIPKLTISLRIVFIIDKDLYRPSEVPYLCGDSTKAHSELGWQPTISFQELSFYKNNKKIFINLDKINKKRIEEACEKNNVDFKDVNYMNILLLYEKNLITKKLIKPLYIS